MTTEIRTWSIRTGHHVYPAVQMPDGRIRAVWGQWDGPDFDGYYTQEVGAARPERTNRADYEAYRRLVYGK